KIQPKRMESIYNKQNMLNKLRWAHGFEQGTERKENLVAVESEEVNGFEAKKGPKKIEKILSRKNMLNKLKEVYDSWEK
ncbi:hypothetical protein GOV03_03825, partial [Candidatus Woesearchaeota archaeon]|nr:hypothetical protein [Candidatus Woesearchaeota archaeon]